MKDWERKQNADIKAVGGSAHRGSGNKWYCPSDGHSKYFRYEHKSTESSSFTIEAKVLDKIVREALRSGQRPALIINIQDSAWAGVKHSLWIAMRDVYGKEFHQAWRPIGNLVHTVSANGLASLFREASDVGLDPVMHVELQKGMWSFVPLEVHLLMVDAWDAAQGDPPP